MKIKSALIATGVLVGFSGVAFAVPVVAPLRGLCTLTIENATGKSFSSNFPAHQMIGPKFRVPIQDPAGNPFLVPCTLGPGVIQKIPGVVVVKTSPVVNPSTFGPRIGNVTLSFQGTLQGNPSKPLNCSQSGLQPYSGYLDTVYSSPTQGTFALCIPSALPR